MKIEGPGRTGGTKGASKAGAGKKTGDTSFDTLIGEGEADQVAQTAGPAGISSLGGLLGLNEVGDAGSEARRKGKRRGELILDHLERVRLALLTGELSVSTLEDLSRMAKAQKEAIDDPRLTEILDEIDMRAQIELAKFGR